MPIIGNLVGFHGISIPVIVIFNGIEWDLTNQQNDDTLW